MKNKYMKLKAMLLAGTIALSGASLLSGCGLESAYERAHKLTTIENPENKEKKVFGVGEHILMIKVEGDWDAGYYKLYKSKEIYGKVLADYNVKQYDYHEGYKIVGISCSEFMCHYVIYENEYPVECYSTDIDKNGNHVYQDFGNPIGFYKEETKKTENTKEFNPGEHNIAIEVEKASIHKLNIMKDMTLVVLKLTEWELLIFYILTHNQ